MEKQYRRNVRRISVDNKKYVAQYRDKPQLRHGSHKERRQHGGRCRIAHDVDHDLPLMRRVQRETVTENRRHNWPDVPCALRRDDDSRVRLPDWQRATRIPG